MGYGKLPERKQGIQLYTVCEFHHGPGVIRDTLTNDNNSELYQNLVNVVSFVEISHVPLTNTPVLVVSQRNRFFPLVNQMTVLFETYDVRNYYVRKHLLIYNYSSRLSYNVKPFCNVKLYRTVSLPLMSCHHSKRD